MGDVVSPATADQGLVGLDGRPLTPRPVAKRACPKCRAAVSERVRGFGNAPEICDRCGYVFKADE